ncbi:MAG: NUDIX hydrolase [Verrucomicrobiota bacterium]
MPSALPYKISVLVFIENHAGELLLMLRAKQPNLGVWSPIGGKLEMVTGESPLQCAVRETQEEAGFAVREEDMHLFAMIAEKAYQGETHWLMFLFRCKKPIDRLPPDIAEGRFAFHTREAIKQLTIPETDQAALWPIYDQYRDGFVALRADCSVSPIKITIEQTLPGR